MISIAAQHDRFRITPLLAMLRGGANRFPQQSHTWPPKYSRDMHRHARTANDKFLLQRSRQSCRATPVFRQDSAHLGWKARYFVCLTTQGHGINQLVAVELTCELVHTHRGLPESAGGLSKFLKHLPVPLPAFLQNFDLQKAVCFRRIGIVNLQQGYVPKKCSGPSERTCGRNDSVA